MGCVIMHNMVKFKQKLSLTAHALKWKSEGTHYELASWWYTYIQANHYIPRSHNSRENGSYVTFPLVVIIACSV